MSANHPVVRFESLSSIGKVNVEAVGEPPEPSVGDPGGFWLKSVRLVKEGKRYAEDIKGELTWEDQVELRLQAQEVYDKEQPSASWTWRAK